MPQRAFNLGLAIVGVLLLAAMVLVGVEMSRVARTGPAWRRRLICAALWLLAGFGFVPNTTVVAMAQAPAAAAAEALAATDLAKTAEWTTVKQAYDKVGPIADAPSTMAQRKEANAAITEAQKSLDKLATDKLLDATEVKIIKDDLSRLQKLMQRKPPTDSNIMCYMMAAVRPAHESTQRINARLELVGKLLKSGKIKPEIAGKAVQAFESDLAVYGNEGFMNALTPEQKADAEKAAAAAKESVEKIKKAVDGKLPPTSSPATETADLTKTKDWTTIVRAWTVMEPLAKSGKSTEAQRAEVEKLSGAVHEAAFALAKAKMLEECEASLLVMEAGRLKDLVFRNPPTDATVTCYKMARVDPVHASYGRVTVRLQFLQKLVKAGRVHPAVAAKVLPTLEADLQMLADDKALGSLPENDRKQAIDARAKAREAIDAIKKLPQAKAGDAPAPKEPAPAATLTGTDEWKSIVKFYEQAAPLAASHKSTRAQRSELEELAPPVSRAALKLAKDGLLDENEARLLYMGASRLNAEVNSNAPTDENVNWPAGFPRAQKAYMQIQPRALMLEKLAASSKAHPEALALLLPTVELDLSVLADPKQIATLPAADQKKAERLRDIAQTAVEKLKKKLLK